MMKYLKKLIPIFILSFILISMIIHSDIVINSVLKSINICMYNLFPAMIPFFILSSILTNYGFVEIISFLLNPIMKHLFHLNSNCAYILILSMLSGTPANAKYIKELLDNNKITLYDANKIILFSHFLNPIFVTGTVGGIFLGSKKLGFILLISSYITNIIIGIFLRGKKSDIKISNKFNDFLNIESNSFINTLKISIKNTISSLTIVFGVIVVCSIISNFLSLYFNFNPLFMGILEITQGLQYIGIANISKVAKIVLTCFYLNFGGIAIHMQVFSIIDNKKIRYLPYLESRIIAGILSSSIALIIIAFL